MEREAVPWCAFLEHCRTHTSYRSQLVFYLGWTAGQGQVPSARQAVSTAPTHGVQAIYGNSSSTTLSPVWILLLSSPPRPHKGQWWPKITVPPSAHHSFQALAKNPQWFKSRPAPRSLWPVSTPVLHSLHLGHTSLLPVLCKACSRPFPLPERSGKKASGLKMTPFDWSSNTGRR